jgi:alginate O-acetyltransferase complex protein AlgJ
MRKLIALLAIGFFFAPIGLRAAGVTAHPFENRRLAGRPSLDSGWKVFDQATRFFVDRMPLREQAVHANTWVWLNVYGEAPNYGRNADVSPDALPFGTPAAPTKKNPNEGRTVVISQGTTALQGRGDWMYLEEELLGACSQFIDWTQAVRRYERLISIIRASGRRVVFVIPPNKSTVYPEYLPSSYKEKGCFPTGIKEVWRKIEAARDPDFLGLRQTLLAAKAPQPEQSYHVNDTHWNTKAAILGLRKVLERVGGRVQMRDDEIHKSHVMWLGDLSKNIGAPKRFKSPKWEIQRDVGAMTSTVVPGLPDHNIIRRAPGGAPLIPGHTLLLDDSFGDVMVPALSMYTSELETLLWDGTPTHTLIDEIASAHTVIMERAERAANYLPSDQGTLTPAFLDRLAARLGQG